MPPTRPSPSARPAKTLNPAAIRAVPPDSSRAQALSDSPEQLSQLQRQYGNRAVQQLIQRKFTDSPPKFDADEQVSFANMLALNDIDPLAFTAVDYAALQTAYTRLAPLVTKVSNSTAAKKLKARKTLEDAYTALGRDIRLKMLTEGKPAWDAAVELAVGQYDGKTPTNEHFKQISGPVWPTVGGRGAMPDSFWKSVKKNIRTGFGAGGGAGAFSPECDAVFADMGTQFTAWDGTLTNRGAW